MHIARTNFSGDPNLGVYGLATDRYALIGCTDKHTNVLGEKVFQISVCDTSLTGLFLAGNSSKIIVPHIAEKYEIDTLKKIADVLVLKTDYTALGNLVLMNDKGCLISVLLKKNQDVIEKFLGLPTDVAKIAGMHIIGSAAVCNNKGCLVSPSAKEKDMEKIEDVLGVKTDVGTVNFGSQFVRSGIIVNSHGCLAGDMTSGPELSRMDEIFG